MHTPRVHLGLFLLDLRVLGNTIVRPLDFAGQEQSAVSCPGDGDFLGFFDTGNFDLDEVFLDGIAEI